MKNVKQIAEEKFNRTQEHAIALIDELYYLIQEMPNKGITTSESQKLYVLSCIKDLEQAINGIVVEDFIPQEE